MPHLSAGVSGCHAIPSLSGAERFSSLRELAQPLAERGIRRALLVTGGFLKRSGATAQLEEALDRAGIRCVVFSSVKPNPTVADPLYPVPRLMDAKELEKFYHMVSGE